MGNAIRFVAKDVSLDPQVGFVGFADQEGRRYFWMQPSGMTTAKDEIWLERDDQAGGGCGGAWNIVLTRDKFVVNTRELRWMACDSVEVDFTVDNATFARLKELLRQVMVDCPTDLDILE
jgi:hypothetical protein